jgi:hypothetical protein
MKKIHLILCIVSFYSIVSPTQLFSQEYAERDLKMLDDSMVVHLGLQFGSENIGVFIYDFPKAILDGGLVIQDLSRPCSGAERIIGSQFSVTMSGNYKLSDTFAIYLAQTEFAYPPVVFTLDGQSIKLNLGEDCYLLTCVPHNDPWMPSDYSPFILRKSEYYINPSNGKIKKAIKFINSGRYTSCDLQHWKYISPMGFYYDKKGVKHKGSDLIAAKKIVLSDWDLGRFDEYFFR